MGPLSEPDDDDLKARLLEQLMDNMDERTVKQSFGDKLNKEDEPDAPVVTEEANGDDLDEDPSLDPELRDLIRAKRGG